jgi:hypothetical protein
LVTRFGCLGSLGAPPDGQEEDAVLASLHRVPHLRPQGDDLLRPELDGLLTGLQSEGADQAEDRNWGMVLMLLDTGACFHSCDGEVQMGQLNQRL